MTLRLSQIFITSDRSDLPELLKYSTNTAKASLGECAYQLFNGESLRDFISSHFGSEVLKAYDTLKPYSYKADLGKYCIAYQLGGWYADVSIKFIKKINVISLSENQNVEMLYFNDTGDGLIPGRLAYSVACGLFYAKPRLDVFKDAIEQVVENCHSLYYGVTAVCPTGPGVLGSCIAKRRKSRNHVVGDFMPLTPFHDNKNRSYIMPDGEIIALHKNAWFPSAKPAEIHSMGAKETNNYLELYLQEKIY